MEFVIDCLDRPFPNASIGTRWQFLTDGVMGGVSRGNLRRTEIAGRPCNVMEGDVSLENNGGFIQMALDLAPDGHLLDAKNFSAIQIEVYGNDASYGLHLRTSELDAPWQSYRQGFEAKPRWQSITLPFEGFVPHRTAKPLNLAKLRRLGFVAIGRAFHAELAMARLTFIG